MVGCAPQGRQLTAVRRLPISAALAISPGATLRSCVGVIPLPGAHQMRFRLTAFIEQWRRASGNTERSEHARSPIDHSVPVRDGPEQNEGTVIPLFTVDQIKPELRGELTNRIVANANMVKDDRDLMIPRILRRFSAWMTPGSEEERKLLESLKQGGRSTKPITRSRSEERRVQIDQGHKLIASIQAVVAEQSGAIAAEWRSHGRYDKSYDARPEHLARDGKVYAIRGNWAMERGLMNKGAGFTDEIDEPGQKDDCRCWFHYLNGLRQLPPEMLTAKGRRAQAQTRIQLSDLMDKLPK